MSKSTATANKVFEEFKTHLEIVVDNPRYFVGLEIKQNHESKKLFVCQNGYISGLLEKFNMNICKPYAKSTDCSLELNLGQCPANEDKKSMENIPFHVAVGGLMFVATVTRPDIMSFFSQISRFLNNPEPEHWTADKHILKYLKGARGKGFKSCGNKLKLHFYSNPDFTGDNDTRRSTTSYVNVLTIGPVIWMSRRQKCVAISMTEIGYIAGSDTAAVCYYL
ncbi:uncharacterized protein LOC126484833 [Schistocerca serialis cubense]|uniref:uncharacterized protein LOC126484833 n=1 Tax=Schistocerca serialis cubense TaxID=2023355 RepID=UPI00214ECB7D|nr:uncharacterized protein LOC126484833 [Schistocerca serialis cubense]